MDTSAGTAGTAQQGIKAPAACGNNLAIFEDQHV